MSASRGLGQVGARRERAETTRAAGGEPQAASRILWFHGGDWMARLIARLLDAQDAWVKPLGEFNRRWLAAILQPLRPLKNFLNGTWLGHPAHAAATDLPIGTLYLTVVLDVANQRAAADIALVFTILLMLVAAATGATDYIDTYGTAFRRATVHSALMVIALVLLLLSLVMRAGNPADRALPVWIGIIAALLVTAGAYVGGDVVYQFGNMVSRHAFRTGGARWAPVEIPDPLPEARPTTAQLGANTLLIVRLGDTIHAMHDVCAHAGGPLHEGAIVDGCIECPWHGSRYRLSDGRLARGPSVYDQPAYELRRTDAGGWEARRRT
jgi:nitrite reductase/ring-hydroxylating ferredoxin subunit